MTKAEVAEAGIVHAPGRRAKWFELFFDLVFVAGVAQLSSAFAASYDLGALRFVLVEPWLFAAAAALAMVGVTTVAATHGGGLDRALGAAWPHSAIAAATAALPLVLPGFLAVPGCAGAAAAQVALSARRRAA